MRPALHGFVSLRSEQVIADLFRLEPISRVVPFRVAFVGRHWSSTEELDLVLLDETRTRALVPEIKWNRSPVSPA